MDLKKIVTILLIVLLLEYPFVLQKAGLISDVILKVVEFMAAIVTLVSYLKGWILKDDKQELLKSYLDAQNKRANDIIQKENETKRLVTLKNIFFNPLLNELEKQDNNNYCKIGAKYLEDIKQMVPLKPSDFQFPDEITNNLQKYEPLLIDWKELRNTTIDFNKNLAGFFEEIKVIVSNKLSLLYWCPEPESDEPFKGYICYNTFIKAIYDEVEYRLLHPKKKQLYGNGEVKLRIIGTKNEWYFQWGNDLPLAVSSEKQQVVDVQSLFRWFIENEQYKQKIKVLSDKQKETYDKALEKVKQDIKDVLKPIELENTTQPILVNLYAGV